MAQDLQQLLSLPAGSSQVAETVSFHADLQPVPGKLTTGDKSPEEASSIVRRAREAERRRVTVLQCGCDLFESEEILETLDPEEQHELLLDFQRLCKHVVERFEGTVVRSTEHGR